MLIKNTCSPIKASGEKADCTKCWMKENNKPNPRGSPKINTESSIVLICECVYGECVQKSGELPQRNISKIATTNQTECKAALWKGLRKKSFEGREKKTNRYSFSVHLQIQKHRNGSELRSTTWTVETGLLLLFSPVMNYRFFRQLGAQLCYSSWTLHRVQEERIQCVSKPE